MQTITTLTPHSDATGLLSRIVTRLRQTFGRAATPAMTRVNLSHELGALDALQRKHDRQRAYNSPFDDIDLH